MGHGQRVLNGTGNALNAIVSGWSLNTIATFAKGNPFTVLAANSTSMDPMTNFRPNRLCESRSTLRDRNVRTNGHYWIDTACFATPAPNHFGDSGANILTGPGINTWDFGLGKVTPIHESIAIEIRFEAFKAFNHAQFLNPNSVMTDTNFGRVTTAGAARQLQLAAKVVW